jgi:hypothetical protein
MISIHAFLIGMGIFGSVPALAYIPPSHFIIKSITKKHTGHPAVRVRSTVTKMDAEKPTAIRFREVAIFFAKTGTVRSWAFHETEQKELYSVERKANDNTAATALLFDANFEHLFNLLKAKGVPLRTEEEIEGAKIKEQQELARVSNSISWVIGRKDKLDPQLWVEKDSFLPIRLVYPTNESATNDVRFEKYKFTREYPYPRTLTLVSKENRALLTAEASDVMVGKDIIDVKTPVAQGFTGAGKEAPSELRDLIEQYYETIR